MSDGYDSFTAAEGASPNSWESLDENSIKTEITELISRIENVSKLLDRMVAANDYDNTSKAYDKLWMEDFGSGGFVPAFYNVNKGTFSKFLDGSSAPPWYGNLSAEEKKSFDASQHYFSDASQLIKPIADLREVMMLILLSDSFKFMRSVLNFSEAGFYETLYHDINQDVLDVSGLLNKSWSQLDSNSSLSARFYREHYQSMSSDQLKSGYLKASIQDHQTAVQAFKAKDRFIPNSNGTYSVNPGFLADMKVIDIYTTEISTLRNIGDGMQNALDSIPKISESLNNAWKNVKTGHFYALIDALDKLKKVIYDFAAAGEHVWSSYKNRDDEAPYCFIRILPAFSNVSGNYGFYSLAADPWYDGTQFYQLYKSAAEALGKQCQDYVNHGQV